MSKAGRLWLKKHFKDRFVQEAVRKKLRSRASFKLQELDERFKLGIASGKVKGLVGA